MRHAEKRRNIIGVLRGGQGPFSKETIAFAIGLRNLDIEERDIIEGQPCWKHIDGQLCSNHNFQELAKEEGRGTILYVPDRGVRLFSSMSRESPQSRGDRFPRR